MKSYLYEEDFSNEKPFSVKEITKLIKQTLESQFPSVWIEGEISNFKMTSSGHAYFTLKDDFAQISAVMFRTQAIKFCTRDIINGVKVRVQGNISVYEKSGNYQIICSRLEKVGLGDLQLKFLELKEKLFKMGWFDAQRKKPIPYLPERIAIVTSQTGAAIRDMLNIIYTRFPSMNVLVFPVKVQGEGAAQDIAFAINKINELNLASVIITGRGGGSIEDLWAFNEFIVAKAIYESSIPVISAVGHEIDFTISDFVADYRAETPSAAAVKVVPMEEELIQKIENYKFDFKNIIQNKIEYYKDLLQSYKNHYCFKEPANQLKQFYQRLDDLFNLLNKSMQSTLAMKKEEIKKLSLLLTSLSPYNILERGYSISLDSLTNKVIRKINDLHSGQTICTILKDGKFESEVKSISPN